MMYGTTGGRAAVMALAVALLLVPTAAEAQLGGLGRRIRDKAKERVEQKEEQAAERIVDAADPATAGAAAAEPASGSAASAGAEAAPAAGTGAAAASLKPGEGAWANYDFVPGERPIFVDDFSADRIGNFPKRLEFRSGNMEIVEWQGQRWLRAEDGQFLVNLPETLPERFTIEFDLAGSGNAMELSFVQDKPGYDQRLEIGTYFARLRSGEVDGQGELGAQTEEAPVKIRIAVDGQYVKLYANEKRALNVPNGNLGRSNRIFFNMNGWSAEQPRMIANLRVNAGGRELYDALAADGRVATQGIFFDTGSDRLRPESTPTLEEIASMLKSHGDLRITVEGHTDNVGNAAANKELSRKRADSVRAWLVSQGIDASRIETAGFGDSKPAADNTTAEGRQQNRRVELVRL